MGEVKGPYEADTWLTMGMLYRDIKYMKSKQDPKYDIGIKAQQEVYDELRNAA